MRNLFLLLAGLSLSVISYTQTLVAYYPFNGNPNDQSGNGRNPTYVGASLTTDRFGNANSAYEFSGMTSGHIEYPAGGLPATNRTISIWFYTSDVSNRPGLFGYGGNGSCGTTLFMAINLSGSGQYNVQGHCGANAVSFTYSSAPVNQWYHWVLTINNAEQKIYINGVLKSTANTFSGSTFTTGTELSFGVIPHTNGLAPYTDANVGYLNGKLDDIRIYDAALSDAQVLQLYQTESTGLVAYYPFNGNANDETGNGHDGTVSNVVLTTDRKSETDKAYAFNGSTSSISALAHTDWSFNGGDFSIAAWINVNTIGTSRIVSAGYDANDGIWGLGFGQNSGWGSGNRINFFVYSGGSYQDFNSNEITAYTAGQWTHVGIVRKGTLLTFYFNGQPVGSTTSMSFLANANSYLSIGCRQQNSGTLIEYFNGKIDELRIYKRALSPNEMAQLADIPFMPDLLAYLPMNGDANDKSGNNRHGSPYGNSQLTTDKYDNNNSAYSFTNPESGISLANTSTLDFVGQPFAISAWVKYSNIPPADFAIAGKHNCGSPNGYLLVINNNIPWFYLSNGGWSMISASQAYNDNKWHHLVATYDGTGSQKLYVDGELKAAAASVVYNTPGSGAPIIIGDANGNCGGATFSGNIDEVKIYGAALDAAQVIALYKQSRGSGRAISLKANDYVEIGNIGVENSITMEAWIKRNGNTSRQYFFSGQDMNSYGFGVSNGFMNLEAPRLFFVTLNSMTAISNNIDNNVLDNGKWHHVAVTCENGIVKFYFDGMHIGGETISISSLVSSIYSIGSKTNFGGTTHDGWMDEVRIWNTALTQAQLRQWMTRKITQDHPLYNNLIRYYNLDESNLFKVCDIRGGNTGILVNNVISVVSGASIGDASIDNFSNPMTHGTILTLSNGEQFSVSEPTNFITGVNIYVVKDPPEVQTGILGLGGNDHYFGVHISTTTSNPPLYTAVYNYTGNNLVSPANEYTLQLFKRDNNSVTTWINSNATLNTIANTLRLTGQNTEYILGSSGWGLPVTLLSLEAKKINATTTQLNWKTAQEINNKGFEVQRSFDGSYFVNIGFVNGAGNSDVMKEYSTTDMPGKTGRVYYRLKQVDFDEQAKLSQIVSVIFDKQGVIKVYPNPAQQIVTIEGADQYNRIQLFDAGGRIVREQLKNSQYLLNMSLNGLKSGIYLLRLSNNKESQTLKLVIGN